MSIQSEAITIVALTRSGRPAYFRTVDIMMIPNCMDQGVLFDFAFQTRLGYKKILAPGVEDILWDSLSFPLIYQRRKVSARLSALFCELLQEAF